MDEEQLNGFITLSIPNEHKLSLTFKLSLCKWP